MDNDQNNIQQSDLSRCRICLQTNEEDEKKIIFNICNCKGASGCVHIECLNMWIATSGRKNCEVCLQKIDIEKIPKYGVVRSMIIFLYTNGVSQLLILLMLIGLIIYVTSIWYIDQLSTKPHSALGKIFLFITNLSVFISVFIISYSPLMCFYIWDLWEQWRKMQCYLEARIHPLEV